ncbi:MAG: rhodanese-like domain-containing protein [Sulfurimonas sp.]|jgi:rhodanese-related sulfurtransferase|nr:rhodanese-like domain-containing protein [Sulfurimonas sp.]MBU1215758.1 rhodanese-like domain-containing protein [bacterium]MBU1435437.1 rhodanese-like domain-containing protein [bacterium]MBU1502639.1 rhodanese-like domain-containing protein [bacterium]MBU3939912.1 rhodanese-like domain-containing protein [bacterium]
MKKIILLFLCGFVSLFAEAQVLSYESYLSAFTYEERKAMKINSVELTVMLEEGTAQLVDIRFKEEYEAWHMPAAINIPMNELPKRLNELDKSKVIVTACPHKDRAIMARTFLKLKGYDTRYLTDGLTGLAEYWRGDNAREFIQEYNLIHSK